MALDEPVGFVEIIVDHVHHDPVRPVGRDLSLDHVDILAERRTADAEAINLSGLAALSQRTSQHFGKTVGAGNLQRFDEAVADHGDAQRARALVPHVVADAAVPALPVDAVRRGNLVADAPDPLLMWRVTNDVVDVIEPRCIGGKPDEAEHHQLAQRQEHDDRREHDSRIDRNGSNASHRSI